MKELTRNCPLCGSIIEYASKKAKTTAENNNSNCRKCSNTIREGLLSYDDCITYALNRGKYFTYHLPAEYYVGITNHPSKRIRQHRQDGKNVVEAHILEIYDCLEDALIAEAEWHKKGYFGCQFKRDKELNRLLYV